MSELQYFDQPERLNPAVKQRWVDALRSGAFRQTTGQLFNREDYGYCCLGVLKQIEGYSQAEDGSELLDPACGLSNEIQGHLSAANDGEGRELQDKYAPIPHSDGPSSDFNEIAQWIDQWL